MRIKKSLLTLTSILLLIAAVIGGIFYLQLDIKNVWADENSWNSGNIIAYSSDVWQNKITENSDGSKTVTIPYCLMYDVVKGDNGSIVYKCSYEPLYFAGLQKLNYEETQFAPDVVVTYPKDGVFPTEFLNNTAANATTIASIGNDPVPVSITVSLHESGRNASFFNMLRHYWNFRVAGKKEVVSQQLLSWNVKQLSDDALSDAEMKTWATKAMKDFKALLGYDELMKLDGYPFLNYLRDKFSYQAALCTPLEYPCTFRYSQNPTSNILLFLYANEIDKDPVVSKFLTIARTKIQPFAPTLVVPTEAPCPSGQDCSNVEQDFQDMQSYEFPVCPIRDIAAGTLNTDTVKLFSEFMKVYATDISGNYIFKESEINAELMNVKTKVDAITEVVPTKLDSTAVTKYDKICAAAVSYGMKDATTVKNLQDTFVSILRPVLGKISLADGSVSAYNSLSDFKRIAAAGYLHGSLSTLAPHELLARTELLNGIEERKLAVSEDRFVASIPLTLTLIYLFK